MHNSYKEMKIKKKKGPRDEDLFLLLLKEILNEKAREIWEKIKNK